MYYSVEQFKDYNIKLKWICNKYSNNDNKKYYNDVLALDTETSHNHEIKKIKVGKQLKEDTTNLLGWVYQWSITVNDIIVYGRKPSEFITFLNVLKNKLMCDTDERKHIIIYIHNLSYDIQYLYRYLIEEYGNDYKILATDTHKFITFSIDRFIFKCSYMLSNRSLAKWSKDLNVKHQKLYIVDYDVIRFQDTKLNKNDWRYMFRDIICLKECLLKQFEIYNDNLVSVPLTATGYVRRTARNNFKKDISARQEFTENKNDFEVFEMLEIAFSGAISHGNRFYINETIKGKIKHRDFVSHYPSQQRVRKYPLTKFVLADTNIKIDEFLTFRDNSHCYLIEITFVKIELKNHCTSLPYLQESKVNAGKITCQNKIVDNGRILKFDGITKLVLTELDFDIITQFYKFEKAIINRVFTSKSGYLPKWFEETIDDFMIGKTHFKDLTKQFPNNEDYSISLMKSKNGLNSCYGMTATNPVRESWELSNNGEWFINNENVSRETLYNNFYKSRNSFMRFEWGVWCTAYARFELIEFYNAITDNNKQPQLFIYCDTDSQFYFSNEEVEKRIEELNEQKHKFAIEHKAYITTENGKQQFYDIFELENENINKFRFLHSKCYGYITDDNKLHLTVAGVPRKQNGTTRIQELGNLDNLTDGFTFTKCGGTRTVYKEQPTTILNINGHLTELSSQAIILNTTKELKSCERYDENFIKYIY